MVSREKILDDLARIAGGAATLLGEAGKQANENFRNRVDNFAQGLDLVPRADLERLEIMLESALTELAALKVRVAALEGSGGKSVKAKDKATGKAGKGKAKPKNRKVV